MAPVMTRQNKALAAAAPPAAPVIDPADRISKLPEEVQAQILSFLPAQEAVRTCVLARTWRHVWRFTRHLLITGNSVEGVCGFVDRLLRVRHDGLQFASVESSEIRFDPFQDKDYEEAFNSLPWEDWEDICCSTINKWISQILKCQIQMLRVNISTETNHLVYLHMRTTPLVVSRHLTMLELTGIMFFCKCLNLDGCPALEYLEINESCLEDVDYITSMSLKHLVMTSCQSCGETRRIKICVPRLVFLWLDLKDVRTPVLERMPELVAADVHIGRLDQCRCEDPMDCYHVTRFRDTSDVDSDSEDEQGSDDYAGQNTTKCVILEGLAQAEDLVLKADHSTYFLRTDLRWCPTFSNLKNLVLIEEYRRNPADCSVLACMLKHAPLLEKLTLILDKVARDRSKYKVEMKGYPDAKVKSTKISQHLQIVEIKCEDFNERLLSNLNFLCKLNIYFETRVTKNKKKKQLSH